MGMNALPDMYARSPRAAGSRAEGIHIRQSTSAHYTCYIGCFEYTEYVRSWLYWACNYIKVKYLHIDDYNY